MKIYFKTIDLIVVLIALITTNCFKTTKAH